MMQQLGCVECVCGNEMCVYVAHERSLATRAGWVLSTLTQAPFLDPQSDQAEQKRARGDRTDIKNEFKHQTGTDV